MKLSLEEVSVNYGQIPALRGISLSVDLGEAVAIIGPNGAGKTTLLKTISGLLRPAQGRVRLGNEDLSGTSAHRIASMGIVQVPEGRQVFAPFTVAENLEMGFYPVYRKASRRVFHENLEYVFALFPELARMQGRLAGTLSGGEQQMLAIARALMSRPKWLLLDEPSLGLAPKVVERIFETLRKLRDDGYTIILVEQNVMLGLTFAQRGYVLEVGEIVLSGSSQELLRHPRIRAVYLGEEQQGVAMV